MGFNPERFRPAVQDGSFLYVEVGPARFGFGAADGECLGVESGGQGIGAQPDDQRLWQAVGSLLV